MLNYIFDQYGTLIDIHTDETKYTLWRGLAAIYRSYGADYAPEELNETYHRFALNEEMRLAAISQLDYPEIDLGRVFLRLLIESPRVHPSEELVTEDMTAAQLRQAVREKGEEYYLDSLCGGRFASMIANIFRPLSRDRLQPYPGTRRTLEELKARGVGIYLLSNAQKLFTVAELALTATRKYFDAVYISSEAGMRKPQPEFLELLLTEQGLDRRDCVFVGNDFDTDIRMAMECHMQSVYVNTDHLSDKEIQKRVNDLAVSFGDEYRPQIISDGDIQQLLKMRFNTAEEAMKAEETKPELL